MDILSVIIGGTLGVIGLVVTGYLLYLVVGPTWRSLRATRELLRLRRATQQLDAVDALIAEKRLIDAAKSLRKLFVLEVVEGARLIEVVREHHQNVLSRCLVIAEELGTRADNIADVERILLERMELLGLHLRALDSFTSLRSRRERAGKEIPAWSQSEFDQRLRDIRKELKNNYGNLVAAIDVLFRQLESSKVENIVYH